MAGGAFSSAFSSAFDIGFDAGPVAEILGYFGLGMPAVSQNFSMTRGDDALVVVNVTKNDGSVIGLADNTEVTARWSYARHESDQPIATKTDEDELVLTVEAGAL